jgi:hypothetical protein
VQSRRENVPHPRPDGEDGVFLALRSDIEPVKVACRQLEDEVDTLVMDREPWV